MSRFRRLALAVAASAAFLTAPKGYAEMTAQMNIPASTQQNHPNVGMWVTADGYVRHNLLPSRGRVYPFHPRSN
jgi:hypothetical protein